jgi:peptidoglycan/LPS O-acetylase OafA/YrhL
VSLWLAAEGTFAVRLYGLSPATPVVLWLASVGLLALSLWLHRTGWGSVRLNGIARRAGLATYPLYLVHNIAGAFVLGLMLRAGVPPSAALVIAVALCVAVSFGFCEAVEPALRRWLDRTLLRFPGFAEGTGTGAAVVPVLPGQELTPAVGPVPPALQAGAATGCSRIGR